MDNISGKIQISKAGHITGVAGDIYHVLRSDSDHFDGFGEVYISTIKPGQRKGWKKHQRMTLNIVVPVGEILFVLYDDVNKTIKEIKLSPWSYNRLTVKPGIWMAFSCIGSAESYLINVANILHDPSEAELLPLENSLIPYEW